MRHISSSPSSDDFTLSLNINNLKKMRISELFGLKCKPGCCRGSRNKKNHKFIADNTNRTTSTMEKTVTSREVIPVDSGDSGILAMEF